MGFAGMAGVGKGIGQGAVLPFQLILSREEADHRMLRPGVEITSQKHRRRPKALLMLPDGPPDQKGALAFGGPSDMVQMGIVHQDGSRRILQKLHSGPGADTGKTRIPADAARDLRLFGQPYLAPLCGSQPFPVIEDGIVLAAAILVPACSHIAVLR
ncbi:hypothetical protein D3C76_1142910 [compost metagenome]